MTEVAKQYKTENKWARPTLVLLILLVLLVAAALFRLVVGESIPYLPNSNDIDWNELNEYLKLRGDRLLKCFIVGVGLSVGGVLLQSILRNPLASPYLLGISSGAALGVIVGQYVYTTGLISINSSFVSLSDSGFAIAGALVTIFFVYIAAQRRGWVDPMGLILVGVIVNAINGAAIMFVHYMAPHGLQVNFTKWMMGVLNENLTFAAYYPILIMVCICWFLSVLMGKALDVATLPDDEAHSLGLHVRKLRLVVFVIACAMTGATLTIAGPIGFVGLVCPHLVRLMAGPNHRTLLIGAGLAGAALVIFADALAKYVEVMNLIHTLLPIGVITAAIGGPIFILLLRHKFHRGDAI